MTSQIAQAGRVGRRDRNAGPHLAHRFLASVRAPTLDGELARGLRPSITPVHQLRADHLKEMRVRRRIATALERAVDAAHGPVPRRSVQVPLNRKEIRGCAGELRALAVSVANLNEPRAQGLAMAFQLAFDGGGPLFLGPDRVDGTERLPNTVRAVQAALGVSAAFDEIAG